MKQIRGNLSCHNRPKKHPAHLWAFSCVSVFIRAFQRDAVCQRVAKRESKISRLYILQFYALNRCSQRVLHSIWARIFQAFGLQGLRVCLSKGVKHTDTHAKAQGCAGFLLSFMAPQSNPFLHHKPAKGWFWLLFICRGSQKLWTKSWKKSISAYLLPFLVKQQKL